MLSEKNKHPRDEFIAFYDHYGDEEHIYILKNPSNPEEILPRPTSVTTVIHDFFPHFDAKKIIGFMMRKERTPDDKYYGMTAEEIEKMWEENGTKSSSLGTIMHASIEDYFNGKDPNNDNIEFTYFLSFWKDFQIKYPDLTPFRTEWLVFDEDILLSGSIDFVLSDSNGDLAILDWKRSKEIVGSKPKEKGFKFFHELDNCNYVHYSLQLNIYRHLLETKYNKRVKFMMLVVLYPENKNYRCIKVNKIDVSDIWNKLTLK